MSVKVENVIIILVAVFMLYLFGHLMYALGKQSIGPNPVNCEEDMDCWDCDTMGNMICGKGN